VPTNRGGHRLTGRGSVAQLRTAVRMAASIDRKACVSWSTWDNPEWINLAARASYDASPAIQAYSADTPQSE